MTEQELDAILDELGIELPEVELEPDDFFENYEGGDEWGVESFGEDFLH